MWSWILAVIGASGIYFVGRKSAWAWFVLLFNECLWIIYAITTKQYGFIFSALAYAAVYIKSYLHWTNEPKQKPLNVGTSEWPRAKHGPKLEHK